MKNKIISLVLIFSLTALGLGMLASTPALAEDIQEEITFWWWGGQESPGLEDYLEEVVANFEADNPGVKINQSLQPTDDLIPAFEAASEARSGPDIATLWYGVYQQEHIWAGHIEPLDPYISEAERDLWLDKELSEFEDQVWASPLYGYGNIMVYNKQLLADAGLDPDNPPVTWEEFLDASARLQDENIDSLAVGLADPGWGIAVLACHFWPQTLESIDAVGQAITGEKSFTDEEFLDMWYRLQELNDAGYLIEGVMSISLEESYAEVVRGNAAFSLINTQLALEWYEEYGDEEIGFMSFPAVTEEPVDWIPVAPISLFITEWSEHKETAAKFLEYLHSDEYMEGLVDINVYQPNKRFPLEQIEDQEKRFVFEQVKGGFEEKAWFVDTMIPYAIIGDGLIPAGQQLVMGLIGPEEAGQMVEDVAERWRSMHPESAENFSIWFE